MWHITTFTIIYTFICLGITGYFGYMEHSKGTFDELLAVRLVKYCASTYQINTTDCFNAVPEVQLRMAISKSCSMASDKCQSWLFTDRNIRSIVIVFGGSSDFSRLRADLNSGSLASPVPHPSGGMVYPYFLEPFRLLWPEIEAVLFKLTLRHMDILVTGHGSGGALASLCAIEILSKKPSASVRVMTFGQPRVGDYEWAINFSRVIRHSWRVVHRRDIVSHLPPCKTIACRKSNGDPYHHPQEIFYDAETMLVNGSDADYTICEGVQNTEDRSCSNKFWKRYGTKDHRHYFGTDVKNFCWSETIHPAWESTMQTIGESLSRVTRQLPTQCDYNFIVRRGSCTSCAEHKKIKFEIELHGTIVNEEHILFFEFDAWLDMFKGSSYIKSNTCLEKVTNLRFTNRKALGKAWMLGEITVEAEGHHFPRVTFLVSEWYSGTESNFGNGPSQLLSPMTERLGAYTLIIKTGDTTFRGRVAISLWGSQGRTRVVSITSRRHLKGSHNIVLEKNTHYTYSLLRLRYVGSINQLLVSTVAMEQDTLDIRKIFLEVVDRNQPIGEDYIHDHYEFDTNVLIEPTKPWSLLSPSKHNIIQDNIGIASLDYDNDIQYD